MNASFQDQLATVRQTLFGSSKPKRTRRVAVKQVPIVTTTNTRTMHYVNSVTITLPKFDILNDD